MIGLIFIGLGLILGWVSSLIGIVLWILGLTYSEYGKRRQEKRDITLLKGQEKIISVQEETKEEIKGAKQEVKEVKGILIKEFTSRKILNRLRRSLKGVLSTEELIKEFDNPLNALIIYKWGEPPKQKLIRDRLAQLGFKDIGAGLKILPPSHMPYPPLKSGKDLENWMKRNVLNSLPKDHKYTIVLSQIVDLRKAYTTKYAPKEWFKRFRGYTLFDKLSWDELFPIEFIRKALKKKTHVSVEELVVEHFPFSFLISRFLSDKDLDRVLVQRHKIIQELKKAFNLEDITLTSFANMNVERLHLILTKFKIMNGKQIAQGMIEEAKIWKTFLEKI